MKHGMRTRAFSLVVVALFATGFLAPPTPSAHACGWVFYKGFTPDSSERKAIETALQKKRWKRARQLLLAERARAERAQETQERKREEPWTWREEPWFYYQLATAEFHLGELAAATRSIKKALSSKRQMNWGPGAYDQIFLLYGNIEFKKKKVKRAITMVRRAVKKNKRDPRLWATLGTYQEAAGLPLIPMRGCSVHIVTHNK